MYDIMQRAQRFAERRHEYIHTSGERHYAMLCCTIQLALSKTGSATSFDAVPATASTGTVTAAPAVHIAAAAMRNGRSRKRSQPSPVKLFDLEGNAVIVLDVLERVDYWLCTAAIEHLPT